MGSPSYCYKKFMQEYIYIRVNTRMSKYEKVYTDEYLRKLSEEELEDLVRRFNKSHKSYAHFTAGVAVANCLNDWEDCNDTINASAGAMSDFMELLGIYDSETVDFEED